MAVSKYVRGESSYLLLQFLFCFVMELSIISKISVNLGHLKMSQNQLAKGKNFVSSTF